ncbi:aldo/keto reductase [Candidatus Lucifugimonas marina]|uniref:Aldo/keto reductase n=1 Tax=Candidatus Lucifugimonas marina TaxID=3038979 RepID=A0AAJ5ZIC2_9CHLR|nr:aldo/keto reductase [SAR202 cluster bacterium JH702]MDG0870873.1 aldo/keto reductase [SAR202 cluster bacterium JH639]WFG34761.1 aldo/keto reductase [SAR202 cluster bacterium JH545]WFG38688.1 aldo/keto reductase [SAR202 cluster bacterium JH1073]
MKYRHLGNSGLEVSEIGLGANSFGMPGRRDRPESEAIVHSAIDHGINFIDTSNVYASGLSEEYIGHALKGRRDEMLIGTKFGSMRRQGPNNFGGSRNFVMRSVEESLSRLQTDYIDVYMIHRPDPRMPIEETLRALDDLVRDGKVRYTAGCNFEAWRLVNAEWTNRKNGFVGLTSSQFAYSMMTRAAEEEMIPACRELGLSVVPYLPLAAGMLSGKVNASGSAPEGTRLSIETGMGDRWITPRNIELVGLLDGWARERGHSVLELAFAWLLAEPIVATVIAGASSPEQIATNAAAAEWVLSADERAEVTAILDANPPDGAGDYYSAAGYFREETQEAPR